MLDARSPDELAQVRAIHERYVRDYRAYMARGNYGGPIETRTKIQAPCSSAWHRAWGEYARALCRA